jgi:hypothetical protein
MWFRRKIHLTLPVEDKRLRPASIQEYLSLTPSQRSGVILTSELVTEICEAIRDDNDFDIDAYISSLDAAGLLELHRKIVIARGRSK